MATRHTPDDHVVLRFAGHRIPRALGDLAIVDIADRTDTAGIDTATGGARRVIVLGADPDLAAVLTRLLRTARLHVEVAHTGSVSARHARSAAAQRVPLIRDETGQVIVGSARWLPADEAGALHGEGVVDDAVLFDGAVPAVRIEPTYAAPGLRARVEAGPLRHGPWVAGRAAQLGTAGAAVNRDGVPDPRTVRRSTFYRNTEGWLRVSR